MHLYTRYCDIVCAGVFSCASVVQSAVFGRVMSNLYDEKGYCLVVTDYKQADYSTPQRLVWDTPPELHTKLERIITQNIKVSLSL